MNTETLTPEQRYAAEIACFNLPNKESNPYILVEKSIPKVEGLKMAKKRRSLAFEIVQNFHKNKLQIVSQ